MAPTRGQLGDMLRMPAGAAVRRGRQRGCCVVICPSNISWVEMKPRVPTRPHDRSSHMRLSPSRTSRCLLPAEMASARQGNGTREGSGTLKCLSSQVGPLKPIVPSSWPNHHHHRHQHLVRVACPNKLTPHPDPAVHVPRSKAPSSSLQIHHAHPLPSRHATLQSSRRTITILQCPSPCAPRECSCQLHRPIHRPPKLPHPRLSRNLMHRLRPQPRIIGGSPYESPRGSHAEVDAFGPSGSRGWRGEKGGGE